MMFAWPSSFAHPVRSRARPASVARPGGRPVLPRSWSRSWHARSSVESLPSATSCPPSPALGEQFGFSRTVIREGLKLLEERGLVRIEQGRGTTVQPRDAWNLLDPVVLRIALEYDVDLSLLDDLIVVRRELEREMARAAARRLTEEELAGLAENLEQMESSYDDYERFRAYDQGFHAIVDEGLRQRGGLDDRACDPPTRRR